jgi:hypothetical protein
MPNEVDNAVGALDDGLDNVDLPVIETSSGVRRSSVSP